MKYIVSFSGGKDSSAMLMKLIQNKEQIDEVVCCWSDVLYEEDYFNIDLAQEKCKELGIQFTILKHSFKDLLFNKYKKFPIFCCRWCTQKLKTEPIRNYLKEKYGNDYICYVGFTIDEIERTKQGVNKKNKCFPLIDKYKMTDKDCLEFARDNGFIFNTKFSRSGCWCCPLMNMKDNYTLITEYPEKWNQIKQWEKQLGIKWKTKGCDYWEGKVKEKGGESDGKRKK